MDLTNDIGPDLDFNFDVDFNLALPPNKRNILGSKVIHDLDDLRAAVGFKVKKRDTIDLNAFGSQILDGLRSHGLNEYIDVFSARIQRLKDLPSNVPPSQITAEANTLLREYNQVLAGLRVNEPVEARDIVINAQVLAQLQDFISSTANLLRGLGKPDCKPTALQCTPVNANPGFLP